MANMYEAFSLDQCIKQDSFGYKWQKPQPQVPRHKGKLIVSYNQKWVKQRSSFDKFRPKLDIYQHSLPSSLMSASLYIGSMFPTRCLGLIYF